MYLQIALVRMSSDGAYPPEKRRKYKHVFNAIGRIINEEGASALLTGVKPAMLRCMVLNVTQIVLYKNTKVILLKTGSIYIFIYYLLLVSSIHLLKKKKFLFSGAFHDNLLLHIICSIWTAMISSVATAPIDITKTR